MIKHNFMAEMRKECHKTCQVLFESCYVNPSGVRKLLSRSNFMLAFDRQMPGILINEFTEEENTKDYESFQGLLNYFTISGARPE